MSGPPYDSALPPTVIGLFKAKCIRTTVFHQGPNRNLADVELATAGARLGRLVEPLAPAQ